MTTAALATINWIRLGIGGAEFTIEPSPGIKLSLAVSTSQYDGYLDPLTRGPASELHISVALIPADIEAVVRCESQALGILNRLGVHRPAAMPSVEFSLDAALGGEGMPYNRVSAPRLYLIPGDRALFNEDPVTPSVHVFTAKAPTGSQSVYSMAKV